MKRIRYLYLVAGFIAGIVYVTACGGASNGIAASIGNAIDVLYTNTTSALSATNVQAAIDELLNRIKVLEASGTKTTDLIGTWVGEVYSNGTDEPENVAITFNEDGTYSCDQSSRLSLEIPAEGNWLLKGNTIILAQVDNWYVYEFYNINFRDENNLGLFSQTGYLKFIWLANQES